MQIKTDNLRRSTAHGLSLVAAAVCLSLTQHPVLAQSAKDLIGPGPKKDKFAQPAKPTPSTTPTPSPKPQAPDKPGRDLIKRIDEFNKRTSPYNYNQGNGSQVNRSPNRP